MRTDSYINLPIPRMRMTYLLPNQIAVIPPETGEYVMFSQGFSGDLSRINLILPKLSTSVMISNVG